MATFSEHACMLDCWDFIIFLLQVYIAECVGVHIVGYVFIVYGGAAAAAGITTGKVIGKVSITLMSLLNVCLILD